MAKGSNKQPIDWITVRYSDIYLIVLIVAALIGLGVGGFLYYRYAGNPKYKAEMKIQQAEKRLAEVEQASGPSEKTNVKMARGSLGKAKEEFSKAHYKQAGQLAAEVIEMLKDIGAGGQSFAVIVDMEGTVEIKKANQHIFTGAKENMLLAEGDMVKTSARSSAKIKYPNGEYHVLLADTYAIIQNLAVKPGGGNIVKTKVEQGGLEKQTPADMNPQDESIVETTDAKFRSAASTRLTVEKSETGGTKARALSGVTQVQIGSETRELNATTSGIALDISQGGAVQTTGLISPPNPLQPRNEQILQLEDPYSAVVLFEWSSQTDEPSKIQISTKPLFQKNIIVDKPVAKGNKFTATGFAPSTYYWRVRTEGDESKCFWSSAQRFRIVQKMKTPKVERNLKLEVSTTPLGDGAIIRGITNPGVHVSVNDIEIPPNADGSFSKIVLFTDIGSQIIVVRAFDDQGNEKVWQREFKSSQM